MYYICKNKIGDIKKLEITVENQGGSNQYYLIKNWNDFVKTLEVLSQVPCLLEAVSDLYDCIPTFSKNKSKLDISVQIHAILLKKIKSLEDKVNTIIDLYELLGNDNKGSGFDVKLPSFKTLDEFATYIKEINFVINQCPFLKNKDEEIKLNCIDVGSTWISFMIAAVGTTVILSNLAKIIDYTIKIKSHITNVEQQEEQLRAMKLKNDVIETVIEGYKKANKSYIDNCVLELEQSIHPLKDGDERGRAEKSLEKLAWLFEKGLEIHSAIETVEVKDLFITQNEVQKISVEETKLLQNNKE
jgi:hypothetical protein